MTYQHRCGCCWPTCILCYNRSGTIPACSHMRACSSGSDRTHLCLQGHGAVTQTWLISSGSRAFRKGSNKMATRAPPPQLGTSSHHVTNPHSGLHFSGSPGDNCRCRSLWCCSTSAEDHRRVFLLHIRLCLQRTQKRNGERRTQRLLSCPVQGWERKKKTSGGNRFVWATTAL